jgi:hypothetical protein
VGGYLISQIITASSFKIFHNERETCPVSGFLKKENLNQITVCYGYFKTLKDLSVFIKELALFWVVI